MIIKTSVGLPQLRVTRYSLRTRAVDFVFVPRFKPVGARTHVCCGLVCTL